MHPNPSSTLVPVLRLNLISFGRNTLSSAMIFSFEVHSVKPVNTIKKKKPRNFGLLVSVYLRPDGVPLFVCSVIKDTT